MTPTFVDLKPFFTLIGGKRWLERMAEVRDLAASGRRAGQAVRQRHEMELTSEKRRQQPGVDPSAAEVSLGEIAAYTNRR